MIVVAQLRDKDRQLQQSLRFPRLCRLLCESSPTVTTKYIHVHWRWFRAMKPPSIGALGSRPDLVKTRSHQYAVGTRSFVEQVS